jgi:Cu+-exporting ATPase
MHPQVARDAPGNCPICGMALEPRAGAAPEEESAELRDVKLRFWFAVVFSLPLVAVAMGTHIPAVERGFASLMSTA